MTALQKRILKTVSNHYWNSHDFNGMLLADLYKAEPTARVEEFKKLILRGSLDLISSEHEVNPHIKRVPPPPHDLQIRYLTSAGENHVCAYPSATYASRTLGSRADLKRPFTRLLQRGHPQLEAHFFSLDVLDRYNMDPRYSFDFAGLDGRISTTEKYYRSRKFPRRDKVLLVSFGLGRNASGTRVLAVFLRYLRDLSAEHQRYWESYAEREKCTIEDNYLRRSLFGEWTEGISIYRALLEELSHINGICRLLGLPLLFREEFQQRELRGFGLLTRTTKSAFENFVHTLDKILSENLNYDFFRQQGLELDEEIRSTNGNREIRRKGTISLLREWLEKRIKFRGADAAMRVVEPLKRVRDIRRGPAHKIEIDKYDANLQSEKEKLISEVYWCVSNIRVLFQTHPQARTFKVSKALNPENIVVF